MTQARRLAAVGLVAAVTLGGCGDGSASEPAPAPASRSTPDSAAPSPSVAPAAGKLVSLSKLSVRVPRGWSVDRQTFVGELATSFAPGSNRDGLTVSVLPDEPYRDLAQSLRLERDNTSGLSRPVRLADTTIGGVPVYHLSARQQYGGRHLDGFGCWLEGSAVRISFELSGNAAHRRQVIESVLATWTWK